MPEDGASDERLAVLRMVESGKVKPEEALELLSALQPTAAAAVLPPVPPSPRAPRDPGVVLRVHCQMDETECDFSVPLDAASDIAEMLPGDLGERVPPKMLQQLARLVGASQEEVLRYQDGEFELVIRCQDRK